MNQNCILQIEDDENDIFLLRHAFKAAAVDVVLRVVRDGQQAVDYLAGAGEYADRSRYPLPALVLLDLKLPRKCGLEVLRWIRQQPGLNLLVVIVLSASGLSDDVNNAYRLGANSYVVKPPSVEKRAHFAKAVEAFWLTHNIFPGDQLECAAPAHAARV